MDPSKLDGLLNMKEPQNGAELQQFVCAANWMRCCIPEFTTILSSLSETLEQVYEAAKARTKRAVAKISLQPPIWNLIQSEAFEELKNALKNAVTLAHPDPHKQLFLFTDASEDIWSGILTQVPSADVDQPFHEQRHELLSFLSGFFKGSSYRWSTSEKEAFAVVASAIRLDYLLMRPEGFSIFTDHKNLTFIFNPLASHPGLARHVVSKIQRWTMQLAAFNYTISHISGEENVLADLLSRWGTGTAYMTQLSAVFMAPIAPSLDSDFNWPALDEILARQTAAIEKGEEHPPDMIRDGLRVSPTNSIWIPAAAVALKIRICIVGHCGRGGHREAGTTATNIAQYFYWTGMEVDVKTFCSCCLHCASTIGGQRIPRPMGHSLHADKPNELLHFDFLFMGDSDQEFKYVLILKDNCSLYIWLEPFAVPDAESALTALLKWFVTFGFVLTWNSDQGSHFKNQVMHALNRALHAHHHFTTPYSPQGNGTVESVSKEMLRAARALLSEFRMKEKEWPSVLPIIQSTLNHTVRPSLDNLAPITVMTQLPPDNPLRTMLPPAVPEARSIEFVKAQRLINARVLQETIEDMHRDVTQNRTRRRAQAIKAHNEKTNVLHGNFEVGDFVLVAKRTGSNGSKLRVKWVGSRRVPRVLSDFTFEVEDLISKNLNVVHANRLKLYAGSQLDVTEELLDNIEHNNPHLQTVVKILDIRFNRDVEQFEVQCKWRGFGHEEPTWEPFANMDEDIPVMLDNFLKNHYDQTMVSAARNS